jgi:hypothetical protein
LQVTEVLPTTAATTLFSRLSRLLALLLDATLLGSCARKRGYRQLHFLTAPVGFQNANETEEALLLANGRNAPSWREWQRPDDADRSKLRCYLTETGRAALGAMHESGSIESSP